MIQLPSPEDAFFYEDNFYLSCKPTRLAKVLALYELYNMTRELPGSLVECGVFKGISFTMFSMMRSLLDNVWARKLIGFDTFSEFPEAGYDPDKALRETIRTEAGLNCIGADQLYEVLRRKGGDLHYNVELVAGDICQTVPQYVADHPELTISLLNLDVDLFEPSKVILENLFPRVVKGGIVILDDYGVFPGETKAVDEYFAKTNHVIRKLPFVKHYCYVIK